MELTGPTNSSASAGPPDPTPANADDGLLRRARAEDDRLLAQLSSHCVDSYFWTEESFATAIAKANGRSIRSFAAQHGRVWWRPFALVLLPINYAVIACAFVFLGELMVLAVQTSISLIFTLTLPYWSADYAHGSAVVLVYTAGIAGCLGLSIAIFLALFPRSARARAFGYVDQAGGIATVVFCGSKFSDNRTINALAWPLFRPLRLAGFQRAWSGIREDVVEWLKTALPEGGEVILAGHSLGGALAQIAAYELPDRYRIRNVLSLGSCAKADGRPIRAFAAQRGSVWWRPFALVFLPVNYAVIACAFVLLGELLVLAVPTLLSLIFTATLPSWFADYLHGSVVVLVYTACIAGDVGLSIAIIMALFPGLASARGFGYVGETGAVATIVFCGSKLSDNFTINALVWPLYKPFRHAGFQRAWSHIREDVVAWLATALPDGGEIILTGHSLGGALAQIAAYELPGRYRIRNVVSFGSSRIGGKQLRQLYMKSLTKPDLATRTRHITHADDAVPRLPPPLFYKHVGRGVILDPSGDLVERTADSLWQSFWKISRGVQAIWSGQSVAQVINPYGALYPKAFSDTVGFLKLAQGFSGLRGISPVAAPLVTILYYIVAVFLFYFRALKKGFRDHGRRFYRDTLAARLIEINNAGAMNRSEYSDRRRRILYYYWNEFMYCEIQESDRSSFWFADDIFFTYPDSRLMMSGNGTGSSGPADHSKAKTEALKALDVVISCAIREQKRLKGLRKDLIDISDGQYTDDSQLKQSKFEQFQRWKRQDSFRVLRGEEKQKIVAQYLSRGLNIGHILVAWTVGHELFLERIVDHKSWIWPFAYAGSYDEALEQVRNLLRAPLVNPVSRRSESMSLAEFLRIEPPFSFWAFLPGKGDRAR
jgi:pimeloyl-ACP methyl ester carboxylesterase